MTSVVGGPEAGGGLEARPTGCTRATPLVSSLSIASARSADSGPTLSGSSAPTVGRVAAGLWPAHFLSNNSEKILCSIPLYGCAHLPPAPTAHL